ncbi:alcohol dehydrogenase catalytic domain-containing protein [Streptomyces sp. NBC_01092]|uniref:alcohol dehydrogenase catalytic domain-containing protein n=1 Tax=Streptomyces sp. NBC_01092 TaxID=2903748 RepID=UPI0038692B0C|nr:alcohol dehydrogenase catalytic domain-containing protein [Streptomyces sp. NBC_01092]
MTRLVLLTRHAHSTTFGEPIADLAAAACAGMLRSAQNEYPGQIQLVDTEGDQPDLAVLAAAAATGQPQIAERGDRMLAQRLSRAHNGECLDLPADGTTWLLAGSASHIFEEIAAVPAPDLGEPVAAGKVRVRVETSGVNFRDTFACLGILEDSPIGKEAAGTVAEVGEGVNSPRPGDRILVLAFASGGSYAPMMDVGHQYVVPLPLGWTPTQASGLFCAFVTAYHGQYELADVRPGHKVRSSAHQQ